MATSLFVQSQHHFGNAGGYYNREILEPFSGQPSVGIDSGQTLSSTSSEQQIKFASPQEWAAQQTFQRPPSKSPNVRDRTPIRHTRPEISRHRSSSRPEALLAYVEQQAQQVQHLQADPVRTHFASTLNPAAQPYQPQQYLFPPMVSPYLQQQQLFDATTPSAQPNYTSLAGPQQLLSSAGMYAPGKPTMSMTSVAGATLNPTDTLYSQSRTQQVLPVNAVPSNFPPISQPLESTPNEAELAGNRQKPQCWDHGCNGRQFSTFSNLLRHQREKSGTATKARCPHCGTEFTRTTARNGHLYGGKCKGLLDQEKDVEKESQDGLP